MGAKLVSSGLLVESGGAAGPTGFAASCRLKGARLDSEAGDTVAIIYKGAAATAGTQICTLRTSDEKQSDEFMLPTGEQLDCPAGVYYSIVNSGGVGTLILYRYA